MEGNSIEIRLIKKFMKMLVSPTSTFNLDIGFLSQSKSNLGLHN